MQDLHVSETLPQMVALSEAYMQTYEQQQQDRKFDQLIILAYDYLVLVLQDKFLQIVDVVWVKTEKKNASKVTDLPL